MICRLCLIEKQIYLLLKNEEEKAEDVAEIIGKYFDFPLDIISHVICTDCWNQVYDFHTFYLFVEEKQKKFRLESQNLIYSSTASTDRNKDTNAEGNVLIAETKDATNTNAEKDVALLQTEDEDSDMIDFEILETDEEDEQYIEAEQDGNHERIDDKDCIEAEEDGNLEKIGDENESNIKADAGDALEDAGDDNNAADIDDDRDSMAVETDGEDNAQQKVEDENETDKSLSDSTTAVPNSQEDTDDTTNDDVKDPLNIDSSKLLTITKKYLCDKPGTSEPANVNKHYKAFKERETRIRNARKKREEANLRIASNVGDLQCDLCAEPWETFDSLLQHFRKSHDCQGYVRCCNNRYSRRQDYADHLELHVNPNLFKCEVCNKVLATRKSYTRHMTQFHPAPGSLKYKCPHCPSKYAERNRLATHITRRHVDGQFKCEECNKIYKTLERLKSHQAIIHKCATTTICDICGRSFRTKGNCEKHKANVHQVVECTSEKSNVQQDVKQTQLECSTCQKSFKNSTALRNHNNNYHKDGQTEYKCDLCDVVKKTKILMYTHKYYHHADRRFNCSYCEKAFKTKIKLKEHESIHTGIKHYRCELCYRTFNARCNLASHKKTVHRDVYK